jgi:hypothetical protein
VHPSQLLIERLCLIPRIIGSLFARTGRWGGTRPSIIVIGKGFLWTSTGRKSRTVPYRFSLGFALFGWLASWPWGGWNTRCGLLVHKDFITGSLFQSRFFSLFCTEQSFPIFLFINLFATIQSDINLRGLLSILLLFKEGHIEQNKKCKGNQSKLYVNRSFHLSAKVRFFNASQ